MARKPTSKSRPAAPPVAGVHVAGIRPRVRYIDGAWYVIGGLVPIDLRFTAHESLSAAMDAVCGWYRNGGGMAIAPYGGER